MLCFHELGCCGALFHILSLPQFFLVFVLRMEDSIISTTHSKYSIVEHIICIPQTEYLRMPLLLLGFNCYSGPNTVIQWAEASQSNYYGPGGQGGDFARSARHAKFCMSMTTQTHLSPPEGCTTKYLSRGRAKVENIFADFEPAEWHTHVLLRCQGWWVVLKDFSFGRLYGIGTQCACSTHAVCT